MRRRPVAVVAALAVLVLGGCGEPASESVAMESAVVLPPEPPDDPSAYRGLRWTPTVEFQVRVDGAIAPWLEYRGGYLHGAAGGGLARDELSDGRRDMVWFSKAVGPYPVAEAGTSPPGAPNGPEVAVLDVLVRPPLGPGEVFSERCGAGGHIERDLMAVADAHAKAVTAWRFDRSAGRIRQVDAHGITCPNRDFERD